MNNQSGNTQPRELILASASPRRRELLAQLGVGCIVSPADIDETPRAGELPDAYVRRMACEKALAGLAGAAEGTCVLGADTAVVIDGQILGKPRDREDGIAMLQLLGGRTHEVMSAVAVATAAAVRDALNITRVTFGPVSARTAELYWATGEPLDKAGGYGIQGRGAVLVEHLSGSYSGVVGLPLYETAQLLREFGFAPGFGED